MKIIELWDVFDRLGPIGMELEVVRSDREIEIFVGVEDEIFEDDVDDECKYDN